MLPGDDGAAGGEIAIRWLTGVRPLRSSSDARGAGAQRGIRSATSGANRRLLAVVASVPPHLCSAGGALHRCVCPPLIVFTDAALENDGDDWKASLGAIMIDRVEGKARLWSASLSNHVTRAVQDASGS